MLDSFWPHGPIDFFLGEGNWFSGEGNRETTDAERVLEPPPFYLKAGHKFSMKNMSFLYHEEENNFVNRDRKLTPTEYVPILLA